MYYLKKLENLLEKLVLLADFGINATKARFFFFG